MRFSATGVWRDKNCVSSVAPSAMAPVTTTTGLGTQLTL
jgi:hypothetical protein